MLNFGELPESKPEWDTPTEVIPQEPSKEATPEQRKALEEDLEKSWPAEGSPEEEPTLKNIPE